MKGGSEMTSDEIEAVLRAATADTSPLRERIAALERALAYGER